MTDPDQLHEMNQKVTELHTFVFGAKGQGGLNRTVETIQAEVKTLTGFRARMAGASAVISLLTGYLAAKIQRMFGL